MNARRTFPALRLALMAIAAAIAFAPAISAPFIWDDAEAITDNPTIARLWPPTTALRPPSNTAVGGRPVVNLTFAINHAINSAFDVNVSHATLSYHILNLLLHLVCGLLLLGILRRTLRAQRFDGMWASRADAIALAVTAIWLVHPIQTEAVNYLTQRTEITVSLFYLATLYFSIRAWDARDANVARRWCIAAIATCLFGMASKEVMLTAPLTIVLYDRAFRWPSWKSVRSGGRLWFYAALIATSLLCIALITAGARNETVGFALGVPWYRYLYSQAWAIAHYLGLVFWPRHLTLDYGIGVVGGWRPVPGVILLGTLGIATLLAWRRPSRWGWFGFLGAWFFLTLAPSSSVVPIISEAAAERRMYLALAAVIVVALIALDALRRLVLARTPARAEERRDRARIQETLSRSWPWAAAGLTVLLAGTTALRSRTYASAEAIWRDAIARNPTNPRAYVNLANAMIRADPARRREADALYRQALAVDSTYGPALYNVAEIAASEGRVGEAKTLLDRARRASPNDPFVMDRYARVLMRESAADQAIPLLETAVNRVPTNAEFTADLGAAYVSVGRLEDAARILSRATELKSDDAAIARSLGAVLVDLGRAREAISYLERVVALDPQGRFGYALLSLAYAQAGRDEDAVAAAVRATDQSNDAYVLTLAGQAMLRADRASSAAEFLRQAARATPNDPQILTTLGSAEAALGKRDEAIRLWRQALSLAPGYAPARQELDRLTGTARP
jgi:tetratricopeptide (TPR) repeat protein